MGGQVFTVHNTYLSIFTQEETKLFKYWNNVKPKDYRQERQKACGIVAFDVKQSSKYVDDKKLLEKILKLFNLKSFEFGTYTKNDDRFDFVFSTFISLYNLKKLLKTKNFGFQKLSLAYGSRGVPQTLGHFEPWTNTINIIKGERSIGVLGHEFAHFLDFTVGSFIDKNKKFVPLSGPSHGDSSENVGGFFREKINHLIDDSKNKYMINKTSKRNKLMYLNDRQEIFARLTEQFISYFFKKNQIEDYNLVRDFYLYTKDEGYWEKSHIKSLYNDYLEFFEKLSDELSKQEHITQA